jgi:cell division protein ZapA (FtsZ GTPase activity inhibitor)
LKPTEGQRLVRVDLFGREYSIVSDDEAEVHRIALYLNEQFEQVRARSLTQSRLDLTTMVAFQAASDFFRTRAELDALFKRVEAQAENLAARISGNLGELSLSGRKPVRVPKDDTTQD